MWEYLMLAFLVLLTAVLRSIGGDGSYEDNFPACDLSGGLMLAAGAAMAWAVPGLALDAQSPVAEGMAVGIAVSIALDINLALGISLGMLAGVALGGIGKCK